MVNKWEEQQLKWGGAKEQNKVAQVPGSRESQFCYSQSFVKVKKPFETGKLSRSLLLFSDWNGRRSFFPPSSWFEFQKSMPNSQPADLYTPRVCFPKKLEIDTEETESGGRNFWNSKIIDYRPFHGFFFLVSNHSTLLG